MLYLILNNTVDVFYMIHYPVTYLYWFQITILCPQIERRRTFAHTLHGLSFRNELLFFFSKAKNGNESFNNTIN